MAHNDKNTCDSNAVETPQSAIDSECRGIESDDSRDISDTDVDFVPPSKKKRNATSSQSKSTRRFDQKYRVEWESNPSFKNFLSRSCKGELYFFCKFCSSDYIGGVSEILRHMKSQKHLKNSLLQVKLKHVKFEGLLCPVFTPFVNSKEGEIDYTLIHEYAEYLKLHHVEGILINDLIGEGMSLTTSERKTAAEEWAKACKNNGQYLMIQVGGGNLRKIQQIVKQAEKIKANAIVILPDLYTKPTDHYELLRYLKTISTYADSLPLLYHHNPSHTHINNIVQLLKDATEIKSFVGLIYNSTDLAGAMSALHVNEDFSIILGSDETILAATLSGFKSIMTPCLNFVPKLVQNILKSISIEDAKKSQKHVIDVITAIKQKGNCIAALKGAMNILTPIKVGHVREPLIDIWQDKLKTLEKELKWLDVL